MKAEFLDGIINEELLALRDDIISRHVAAGQVASGGTSESFEIRSLTEFNGQLLGPQWAGVLERGRKPGKVPYEFEKIIKQWAIAKGISFSDPKVFDQWAKGVAWKIRLYGTEMHRTSTTEDIFTTAITEFELRLQNRVSHFFEQETQTNIFY